MSLTINPHIRPDEVIVQTSRETFVCREDSPIPTGGVIVARGPDRRVLLAELTALGNVAGQIIRRQS